MEYRTLGRTGWRVSAIGLGTEYLLDRSPEVMAEVLQTAVAAGINYVDLLYDGPRFWKDFTAVLRPLRSKFMVQAHWGVGEIDGQLTNLRDQAECKRFFDQTLANLGNDFADVGMLMMVDNDKLWDTWGVESLEIMARYKREGRIGAIGLSSHKAATALRAIEGGQVDVLMFPVNMAAHEVEGNLALYQACAEHGVGLVAMKPFGGGTLFLEGDAVTVHWYQAGAGLKVEKRRPITPVQCLSYVLAQPVATVVPGVKSAHELREDLRYLEATDEEKDYHFAIAAIKPFPMGQCIYCNHCLPCPQGIDIGQTIRLLDSVQGLPTAQLRAEYAALAVKASECLEDGVCMERCPYEVDVITKMQQAATLYEQ